MCNLESPSVSQDVDVEKQSGFSHGFDSLSSLQDPSLNTNTATEATASISSKLSRPSKVLLRSVASGLMNAWSTKDFSTISSSTLRSSLTDSSSPSSFSYPNSCVEKRSQSPQLPVTASPSVHWAESLSIALKRCTPLILIICYYVGSIAAYAICDSHAFGALWYLYMFSNAYIAFTVVIETFLSYTPWKQSQKSKQSREQNGWKFTTSDEDLPVLDVLMVAYLPNEQDIIEDRARYLLEEVVLPKEKLRVNILYNTPYAMDDLETRLHHLSQNYPNIRVIKVPKSTSKADNINYFLSLGIKSDVIAVYDCDHYPHPYGPRLALERFVTNKQVDIVQGRCVVLNAKENLITRMVAAEFDRIYAVSHPGRSELWGFGLFCGSNGFWKTGLLQKLRMDTSMLTEDIDSALRALHENAHAVHDLNVISYELAPTRIAVLMKQRLRWAQGWTQASVRHLPMTWTRGTNGNRSIRIRMGIFSLLLIREISYYLVTQYTCFVVALVITGFPNSIYTWTRLVFFTFPLSEWLFLISLVLLFLTLSFTFVVRSEFTTIWMVLLFSTVYPFYLVLVASLGVYSHARQFVGYSSWNPTPRS